MPCDLYKLVGALTSIQFIWWQIKEWNKDENSFVFIWWQINSWNKDENSFEIIWWQIKIE